MRGRQPLRCLGPAPPPPLPRQAAREAAPAPAPPALPPRPAPCPLTEIHWIEYGTCQQGNCPAANATAAARTPYFGIFGPYNASLDPWSRPEVADYMRFYLNQTSAYLLAGGCDYDVASAYLWT